jgi:rhodanese-related sulfurtransferase
MKKKKNSLKYMLVLWVSMLSIVHVNAQQSIVEHLDAKAYQSKLLNLKGTILDVRTADEFESGHLKNAINMDWNSKSFKKQAKELPKFMPLFVYCGSGYRSGEAAKFFEEEGFKTIINLEGGLEAWEQAGLPLETGKK